MSFGRWEVTCSRDCVLGWLAGRFSWLAGWLAGSVVGGFVALGWVGLATWQVGYLAGWLLVMRELVGWLLGWLVCLVWLVGCSAACESSRLVVR